jgi:hypothetical protein
MLHQVRTKQIAEEDHVVIHPMNALCGIPKFLADVTASVRQTKVECRQHCSVRVLHLLEFLY